MRRQKMPVFEYVLLALLGSAGAAAPETTPGNPAMRTIAADAITQPNGGAEGNSSLGAGIGLPGQATGGSPGKQAGTGRKGKTHFARRHRRGHRHTRTATTGKKPAKV
jgi:hypothetical protein